MNKKYTLLIILFFLTVKIFSQIGFHPGYIVKNNGDTLHGLVYLSSDRFNMKHCRFKRFELALPQTYTANQLKGYGITGKRTFETRQKNDRADFVEVLVRGEYSLIKSENRYILEKKGVDDLLISKSAIKDIVNNHAGRFMADSITMKESNLIALTMELNKSEGVEYTICKREKELNPLLDFSLMKNQNEFGIMAGSVFDFGGSFKAADVGTPYEIFIHSSFSTAISPVFGFYYLHRSALKPRNALLIDLTYSNRFIHASSTSIENSITVWNDAFYRLDNVMVSILFRRNLSEKKNHIYLQCGPAFSLIANGTLTDYNDKQTGLNIDESFFKQSFRSDQLAFRLGMGWEKSFNARKIFIQVDARYGISDAGYYYINSWVKTYRSKLYFYTPQIHLTAGVKL